MGFVKKPKWCGWGEANGSEWKRMEVNGSGRNCLGEGLGSHMPVSEAFRCHGANLLPFTKFIGSGLFIK